MFQENNYITFFTLSRLPASGAYVRHLTLFLRKSFYQQCHYIYCRTGNFSVFRFLRICDCGTFREILKSFDESSTVIIIILRDSLIREN